MTRGRRAVAAPQTVRRSAGLDDTEWMAEEILALCEALLSNPNLRVGPYVLADKQLESILSAGATRSALRLSGPK